MSARTFAGALDQWLTLHCQGRKPRAQQFNREIAAIIAREWLGFLNALPRRKFYYDDGQVEIAADLVYELDAEDKQLRFVKLTHYTAEKVRSLCASTAELRARAGRGRTEAPASRDRLRTRRPPRPQRRIMEKHPSGIPRERS